MVRQGSVIEIAPRPNAWPVRLAIVALAGLVLAEVAAAIQGYFTLDFHSDAYFLLDAGRHLVNDGVARVEYLPHSTEGWDIAVWSYYLTAYLYAALVALFGIQFHQQPIVWLGEWVLLLATVFAMARHWLAWRPALIVTAVVMLDPGFISYSSLHFHLLATVLVLLALIAADATFERQTELARASLALTTGALAGAATLAFTAIGLPAAMALTVWMALQKAEPHERIAPRIRRWLALAIGGLLWLVVLAVDLVRRLDPTSLRDLILTLGYHYGSEGGGGGIGSALIRGAYFVAGVIVSPDAPTLLAPVILAIAVIVWTRAAGTDRDRRLLRLVLALVASWLVLGVLEPRNIYAARMVVVLPLGAVLVARCFARVPPRPRARRSSRRPRSCSSRWLSPRGPAAPALRRGHRRRAGGDPRGPRARRVLVATAGGPASAGMGGRRRGRSHRRLHGGAVRPAPGRGGRSSWHHHRPNRCGRNSRNASAP